MAKKKAKCVRTERAREDRVPLLGEGIGSG